MKPLQELRAVEAGRRRTLVRSMSWTLVGSVFVFLCFAVGHWLGPVPLRAPEFAAGLLLALVLGIALGIPWGLKRRDQEALGRYQVQEGPRRRRLLVFDQYWLIDDEILLLSTVLRSELHKGKLLLRYRDPVAEGPLLREFLIPEKAWSALAQSLSQNEDSTLPDHEPAN